MNCYLTTCMSLKLQRMFNNECITCMDAASCYDGMEELHIVRNAETHQNDCNDHSLVVTVLYFD